MYLETHCNIGSKSVSHRRTWHVTQLFTCVLTQRRTASHAHIGLFTFASWLRKTSTAAVAEICFSFRAFIRPKPYVPHQNSHTKGTSLGCSPRNDARSVQPEERLWVDFNSNKNSSGDEIANVHFLRRYRTYFKILKRELTSFNKLDDS